MSRSISGELKTSLLECLDRSWLKDERKRGRNTASVARTTSHYHLSGLFESRTHLQDIPSEHAAVALAVARKDPRVLEVITMVEVNEGNPYIPDPIVIKFLADHVRRTGAMLWYRACDRNGNELFTVPSVVGTFYNPPASPIFKIRDWTFAENKIHRDASRALEEELRAGALRGSETHFSSDTKTVYGAAVLAEDFIYFGGVYSAFDRRLGLHAEMVAALSAIADGHRRISHVALISNKFVEEAPSVCGCCRQFLSEIAEKTGQAIDIVCFPYGEEHNGKIFRTPLASHLPHPWHSGLTLEERGLYVPDSPPGAAGTSAAPR